MPSLAEYLLLLLLLHGVYAGILTGWFPFGMRKRNTEIIIMVIIIY